MNSPEFDGPFMVRGRIGAAICLVLLLVLAACSPDSGHPREENGRKRIRVVALPGEAPLPAPDDVLIQDQVEREAPGLETVPALTEEQRVPPGELPDYASIYARVAPSVVEISSQVPGRDKPRRGTGFFIDSLGRILTSGHVVEAGDKVLVRTWDQREFPARVLGMDRHTDLAVLDVDGDNLPPPLPFSLGEPQVGDWILAVGNPLGLTFSATRGIISATGRSQVVWDPAGYYDYIQTDAAINLGNSGGPLVDTRGAVVGICAVLDPDADRISFAVPASMAAVSASHLIRYGRLVRSWLGVQLTMLDHSVSVLAVLEGSPASRAGIKPGDRVVAWQGEPVDGVGSFRWDIAKTPVGEAAEITVDRDGELLDLVAVMEDAPLD